MEPSPLQPSKLSVEDSCDEHQDLHERLVCSGPRSPWTSTAISFPMAMPTRRGSCFGDLVIHFWISNNKESHHSEVLHSCLLQLLAPHHPLLHPSCMCCSHTGKPHGMEAQPPLAGQPLCSRDRSGMGPPRLFDLQYLLFIYSKWSCRSDAREAGLHDLQWILQVLDDLSASCPKFIRNGTCNSNPNTREPSATCNIFRIPEQNGKKPRVFSLFLKVRAKR